MVISNKVVAFAILGLVIVAGDTYLAHKQNSECAVFTDVGSMFDITQLSSNNISAYSFNGITSPNIEINATAQKRLNQCLAAQQNQVSWWDWVFSDSDSGTFHYLDLLELLTPNNNDYSSGGSSRPTAN